MFFTGAELTVIKPPVGRVPQCGACGLYKTCKAPKLEPVGRGRRKILVVAEFPGEEEDLHKRQLVGSSSRRLTEVMQSVGIDIKRDCIFTSALICHPPGNKIKNERAVEFCRPNLVNTIEEHDPEIIIPIGGIAIKSLLGWLWKDDVGGIQRWAGFQIPNRKLNAWICPMFHPAWLVREKNPVLDKLLKVHMEAAASLECRPWDKKLTNLEDEVEVLYDVSEAANRISKYREGIVAFDYETNMLKPDSDKSEIVSCSICWNGKETIAYPWHGETIRATREMLMNRNLKFVGSNIKFEDRWTRKHLKVEIGNSWYHDTMLGAHAIYNASKYRSVTSIKFQAFVHLGAENYSSHIEPYLKTKKGGNEPNRIRELDLKSLLVYNGLDSLLEYRVAKHQLKILKKGVL